jgi:C-terminal processing protease CtpA/Prc
VTEPLRLELGSQRPQTRDDRKVAVLGRRPSRLPTREPRPPKISEIRPGLWYVDLTRITDSDWQAKLAMLESASALIFDLRGYPANLSTAFLQNLTDVDIKSPQWLIPVITAPDHESMKFERGGWTLHPKQPYLKAKKIFLADARAISYAETCLAIIEYYKLGDIVGGPTAGTNGNINHFSVPGGFSITWTGMKVLKHDGSQFHGIGILPTVPVSRTLVGVAAGKDEVLDRALDFLQP